MTHPKKPREESYQQARAVYEFLKRPDVNVIETLARNIDNAERRGFERAKRDAVKALRLNYSEMSTKRLRNGNSMKIVGAHYAECYSVIENMKYEDSHDEA